jgi:hypothetical protein
MTSMCAILIRSGCVNTLCLLIRFDTSTHKFIIVFHIQEPILFNTTIWENIAYGMDEDAVTQEQIIDAAKRANIHDFVIQLPKVNRNYRCRQYVIVGLQHKRGCTRRRIIRRRASTNGNCTRTNSSTGRAAIRRSNVSIGHAHRTGSLVLN